MFGSKSRNAQRLLNLLCKPSLVEEIMGDLYEYESDLTHHPRWKRPLLYWFHVFTFFKPWALRNLEGTSNLNQLGMLKNYFKTTVRSAMRNPLSSFINLFGLSVAIGMCLIVYAFVKADFAMDHFHEYKDEVFLVTSIADRDGSEKEYGWAPAPLGPSLMKNDPNVLKMSRLKDVSVIVKQEDHVFYERVRYVDSDFLEMFTFPLSSGNAASLKDINNIILSQRMSEKYFGDEDPVGKEIMVLFSEAYQKRFTVSGVAEPFPDTHIIDFSFLVNFENLNNAGRSFDDKDWSVYLDATFIQVDDPGNVARIAERTAGYSALQNELENDWKISEFSFNSLNDLHLNSAHIINSISHDMAGAGRIALPIIGLLMLLLACVNYMNMAIASAVKRLKEIGVRKVVGANRIKVIVQFLAENIILTTFALLLGAVLAKLVFHPWFVNLTQRPLSLEFNDPFLYTFSIGLVLFTGVLSGAYPAFFISRFKAVTIFKGNARFGKKSIMSKVFLGMQLSLACITITGSIVLRQNTAYQSERNRGYGDGNVVYANISAGDAYSQLSAAMKQDPRVNEVAGARDHIGRSYRLTVVDFDNRKLEVRGMHVGSNYISALGVELKEGRAFNPTPDSDRQSVLINETFARVLGEQQLTGQRLKVGGVDHEIIGIVRDFHSANFNNEIKPVLLKVAPQSSYKFLALKVVEGQEQAVLDHLREEWKKLYPEAPFIGGLQAEVWGNYIAVLEMYEKFNNAIALVAVILATLGLYGLISLNISDRVKEFSIRRVLGAHSLNILKGVSIQFLWIAAVALVIGAPLSYFMVKAQLGLVFVYAMPMKLINVVIASLILIAVLNMVILSQVFKVSRSNPIKGLRSE